jgi:hypothetical protein
MQTMNSQQLLVAILVLFQIRFNPSSKEFLRMSGRLGSAALLITCV